MTDRINLLEDKRIILGVTGSIAAYKAADLASKLTQAGALVDVILTTSAKEFIAPLTFQALTGRPVYSELWQTDSSGGLPTHIAHVGLAEGANLLIIAPATAQHLAKLANGMADDLLCITALGVRCPVVIAPAMDGTMYEHPAVVENLKKLRDWGYTIIEPEAGRMASGMVGRGRLPEVQTLIGAVRKALGFEWGMLQQRHIVVTAGGTREALDPVRYISNRSSGKQGYAVAQASLDAGATVTLITTPTAGLVPPYGATLIEVESVQEMLDAVLKYSNEADALIMAAAVSDFTPSTVADHKIKKNKGDLSLKLTRTTDILATVGKRRAETGYPHVLVGFAAETQDLLKNAKSKLERKNVDFIIANNIAEEGAGFGSDTNIITILGSDGSVVSLPQQSKTAVAEAIIQRVAAKLQTVPRRHEIAESTQA